MNILLACSSLGGQNAIIFLVTCDRRNDARFPLSINMQFRELSRNQAILRWLLTAPQVGLIEIQLALLVIVACEPPRICPARWNGKPTCVNEIDQLAMVM